MAARACPCYLWDVLLLAWFRRIESLSCSSSAQPEPQAGFSARTPATPLMGSPSAQINPYFLAVSPLFSPSSVYQPPASQQNPPCVRQQVAEERKFHESHTNIPATEHAAPQGRAWTNCAAAKQSSQQQHHGKNVGSKMFQEAGAAPGCPAQGQAGGGYLEKDNYIRT